MRALVVAGAVFILTMILPVADGADLSLPPSSPDLDSTKAEPGLTYGKTAALAIPKTILFSAGPDHIIADAEEWSRRGINAFFLDFVAREWSSDIWARDGKPWTIGESDETFQQAKKANEICRRIGSETFLKIAFDHTFEWFNDIAWQHIYHNFRQFAIFARETGCAGIALDIEYVGEQYDFEWEGYTYDGYTRRDLVEKIRERMTTVIQVLYDEFPDMVFLTFPEQGLSLGMVIHVAWIEEAARRNAPGGVHYCTEYTYRNPNVRYMFAHAWACNDLFQKLLSKRGRKYWVDRCSIAAGIWPFGFNYQSVFDPGMPYEEFRQGLAASLMVSSRYNWIYSHNSREQLIGRDLDKYTGDADLEAYLRVIADKDVITTPKYVALAKELREMRLRDYSGDLGLLPFVSFAGPQDVPLLRLMPVTFVDPRQLAKSWEIALEYFRGADIDLQDHFATQTNWMFIGPFENGENFSGHNAVYPPEQMIDLNGVYDGVGRKVRWMEHRQHGSRASVDLTKVFEPTEHVCAYALCYVTSPREQEVQIRLGTNDSGKLWVGGKLIFDYPHEGTAFLDREIIPVKLPAGTTPILLKICNGELNWGFVFRITDREGHPLEDLRYTVTPAAAGVYEQAERQLTFSPKNHDLDNNDNFSRDSKFLCYDTRGTVGPGIENCQTIEKVEIATGIETVLYKPSTSVTGEKAAPGVGAASFSPVENKVVFIHGPPLDEVAERGYYGKPNRNGAEVVADGSGEFVWLDKRDTATARDTTPGAHRGGTHRHEYTLDGRRVGFTYDDALLSQYDRTVGYMERQRDAPAGATHYFALLVSVVPKGTAKPGEIEQASGDSWVGARGLMRAFIGKVRAADGVSYEQSLFVVDVPADVDITTSDSGSASRFPSPPEGVRVRRMTHTYAEGVVRGTVKGDRIAYYGLDKAGRKQLFIIPSDGSDQHENPAKHPVQATRFVHGAGPGLRWHPSGNAIACISNNGVAVTNVKPGPDFGRTVFLTAQGDEAERVNLVWSPEGKFLAFNKRVPAPDENGKRVYTYDGQDFLQIFLLDYPDPDGDGMVDWNQK